MRRRGRIASWFDDKGYGFIEAEAGGPRLFVHISAIDDRRRRPSIGDTVTYEEARDERGRLRASSVALAGGQVTIRKTGRGFAAVLLAGAVPALALSAAAQPVVLAYLLLSLVTFGFYAFDKFAAQRGNRRVPESTLHALGVAGGWPGALAAQRIFRHKTRKRSFQALFWITVLINLAALGWLQTGDRRLDTETVLQEILQAL